MVGRPSLKPLTIITGHYGCGKTNLAINLALDIAAEGAEVTLVDLDIVNPYFRSSDYTPLLVSRGVKVVSPRFAGTTLDTPSLSPEVYTALESEGQVILDVGGDAAGATTLGRFSNEIEQRDYDLLYVVNAYRNLTTTPEDAVEVLDEIASASRLHATGVVNNSHLRRETTVETVLDSMPFARRSAELLGLPLRFTTVPVALADAFSDEQGEPTYIENKYPVEIRVLTPWEEFPSAEEEVTR